MVQINYKFNKSIMKGRTLVFTFKLTDNKEHHESELFTPGI